MAITLTITETGLQETIKFLETERDNFKFYRSHNQFLRTIIEPWLRQQFSDVFSTSGFNNWAPLDEDTLAQKRKTGRGNQILINTRRYRRACENLDGMKLRRNVLEIVSPIPYAKYLELGTRDIPARPVFKKVADKLRRNIKGLYQEYRASQGN